MKAPVIDHQHLVFEGSLQIEEVHIRDESESFKRLRVKREDAAAVLILNRNTNKIILTKQFRYPIADKTNQFILELVAGKVDEGEEPLQTAIREAEEETGYRIKPDHIQLLVSCFSTPGYSSECFYIYYATVTSDDRVSNGGGLKNEHEHIEVVEIDSDDFTTLIKEGKLQDAKTYVAGLYISCYL